MTNGLRAATAALLTAAAAAPLAAQQWDTQTEANGVATPVGTLLIRDLDAVWTAAGPVQHGVSILIRDGIIRAIGSAVSAPANATVIDGHGLTAMPGVVDQHSHIAMAGGNSNEWTAPVVPEVRVIDELDPHDFAIYQALSGGVTTAQILHGSANPIGGQNAIIKTRWGMDDPWQLLLDGAPRTVKFALGENVTQKNGGRQTRFPASREGVEAIYVQAFTAAQEYEKAWADYRSNPKAFRVPPRKDLRLQALADIMHGRIRVTAHSYRADEILMLARIAQRFGFTIDAFTHVLEGYKVADELREAGMGASTFADWWMYKLEAYDAIPYNPAILHDHGVLTSINSDIPWLQSFLIYEMNKPVKYGGVSKQEALKMLTLNPAKQIHVEDKVGSLEVGKQGDVVLLDGDPFNTFSRVEKTIIDGIVYYDRSKEAEARGEPVRAIADAPAIAPPQKADTGPVAVATRDDGGAVPDPVDPGNLMAPVADAPLTAIVGGTVHPVSRAPIENGVVVLENGRIRAVGTRGEVPVPAGARVVDAAGKQVYPGLIDPLTSVGMVEIDAIQPARDDREIGDFNPNIRALYGINPYSAAIPVGRANGVTAVLSAPSSGTIRGAGSVVQLVGDTPEKMAIRDRAAIVVDFPRPKGESWDAPKLEGEGIEQLLALFKRARLYAERPSTRQDPTRPFEPNVDPSNEQLLQALAPAMKGELPVIFIADRERDIRTLFMFLDSFPRVKAVLAGGQQAFHVARQLARRSIPVIVGSELIPADDRDDPVTGVWRNAAILHGAGVKIAFTTSFSPEGVSELRNLPYEGARAVAYGLAPEEALRGLTLSAAEILGLGDRMGSLDPGKRADVIVTDGDPLQIVSHVERMFIGGREVSLASKQTRLYQEFRDRKSTPPAPVTEGASH